MKGESKEQWEEGVMQRNAETDLISPLSNRNSSTRFGRMAGAYSYTVPGDSVSI